MGNKLMAKGIYLALRGLGVRINDMQENEYEIILYISVPQDTVAANSVSANGEKMAGAHLAKTLKEKMSHFVSDKRLVVKYKIRNEIWTDEKRKESEKDAKMEIGGF